MSKSPESRRIVARATEHSIWGMKPNIRIFTLNIDPTLILENFGDFGNIDREPTILFGRFYHEEAQKSIIPDEYE